MFPVGFSGVIARLMEYNLVEMWLRKDPIRWIAGALAGVLAGGVAAGVAMIIAKLAGFEGSFPIKLIGTIILGAQATEIGNANGFLVGGLLIVGLGLFLGVIFSHFCGVNSLKALIPLGLVWGTFSWIFIWNLFLQSFNTIFAARIPSGPVFAICIAFGLALVSVSSFDQLLRNKT